MKKATTFAVVVTLAMCLCFALTESGQADLDTPLTTGEAANWMVNGYKAAPIPVWKITIEGTAYQVCCKDAVNARFCIYDNGTPEDETDDAVLDKETGLWWERSPDDTPRDWYSAISHCYKAKLANRKGLRLPTIEELASLVRYEGALASALPAGHPFINVKAFYYSSSTSVNGANQAWGVDLSVFGLGSVVDYYKSDTAVDIRAWCVRGGQGHNAY